MNSKRKKVAACIIAFLVLLTLWIFIGVLDLDFKDTNKNPNKETEKEVVSQANQGVISFEGKEYVYNNSLKNILFLGIDNDQEIIETDDLGKGGQADSIMILSMDTEKKTTSILQVSRNAMTEIDLYDKNGNKYGTENAQIAIQYSYGNGGTTSCWATKRTVSELLGDLTIKGYFALDISGVSIINDLIGGVTITIPEDYTEIDPAFQKGATITLNGKQAERYIRYRDKYMIGGNDLRMERQAQYVSALMSSLKKLADKSDEELKSMLEPVMNYLVTDLTADELVEMLKMDWSMEEIQVVPGESVKGEKYEEFYVDEENLEKLLIKMFYKLK